MAAIDDEIVAIREAIATGAKRIRLQDGSVQKEVEYPTFADLRARLNFLEGLRDGVSAKPSRVSLATYGSGR